MTDKMIVKAGRQSKLAGRIKDVRKSLTIKNKMKASKSGNVKTEIMFKPCNKQNNNKNNNKKTKKKGVCKQ